MSTTLDNLPEDFPDYCRHADEDAPVPSWEEVTRGTQSRDEEMLEHVSRIVCGGSEQEAREVWENWPKTYRRSTALIIDKVYNEGWLSSVGPIKGWPWDGGFFFHPRVSESGTLSEVLDSKSGQDGVYIRSTLRNGLFAYLNASNHRGWVESWMENNIGMAALHVGVFEDGAAEIHMEAFNPLYVNGAPSGDVVSIPFAGSYNHKMFMLHRRWEQSEYSTAVRRSANFYYMMRGDVPLSF
ncbi:MAG TPA: hypothetical protein VE262_25995 [Blastocatellia bacterium]|nr:hypothetical protein [Blastocatellia bacterium]